MEREEGRWSVTSYLRGSCLRVGLLYLVSSHVVEGSAHWNPLSELWGLGVKGIHLLRIRDCITAPVGAPPQLGPTSLTRHESYKDEHPHLPRSSVNEVEGGRELEPGGKDSPRDTSRTPAPPVVFPSLFPFTVLGPLPKSSPYPR